MGARGGTWVGRGGEEGVSADCTTGGMVLVRAEGNRVRSAPAGIWVARPKRRPKLKTTLVPGWAASNCWPNVVNDSFSEAAANTLTVPDTGAEFEADVEGFVDDPAAGLDEPHPASRSAAPAILVRMRLARRICCSKGQVSGGAGSHAGAGLGG